MTKLKPKDLIAMIVIISFVVLKFYGIDSGFDGALALMLGYYFAHRKHGNDTGV